MNSKLLSAELRAGWAVVAGFALLTVYFTGFFPPFSNPNELSRLEMIFAFVENGTFQIDRAITVLGNHEDKALAGGHFYSNKAPGLGLAAIPVYRVLRLVFPSPHTACDPLFVLLRILVVSILCVLALARFHIRLVREGTPAAALVTAAVAFGTPYVYYARSFFAHAWTAALLFLAWDVLKGAEWREPRRRVGLSVAGAGFLAGWAAISEYTVAPIALLLALRAGSGRSGRRQLLFASGALIPVLVLLAYDAICFGSPWILSSAREADPAFAGLAQKGIFGLGMPSWRVAVAYLFHPARGLLLFSPFWICALPGLLRWPPSAENRSDRSFVWAAVALFFVLLTGYPNWHGGWSLGNRYLLPVLFFAALPLAHALATPLARGLFAVMAVFSAANHFLIAAAWPHFPADLPWPPSNGSLWFLLRGWFAPNLLSALGLVSLLPPALIVAMVFALALRAARPLSGSAVAGVLAMIPFFWLLRVPPEPPHGGKLWRASIFGAYSGLDPKRQELERIVLSANTPSERMQAIGAWRLYGRK